MQPAPPPPPPAMMYMHPQHGQQQMQMPPISEMLIREAEAWRALLGLHGMTMESTRQAQESVEESTVQLERAQDESDQREAMYNQSVSHLLTQYDALTTELIKIRGLRKARRGVEVVAQREVLRAHSDETLALGSMIATHSGQSVAGLTSDLRKCSQQLRTQLEQSRALLQALQEVRDSKVPANTAIVIGIRSSDGETLHTVSEVLHQLHTTTPDSSITEEGILTAFRQLSSPSARSAAPAPPTRTVPRRTNAA